MGPLPGQKLKSIPQGETCEDCDNPATVHMVGEVDSFGYETISLCDAHYEQYRNEAKTVERECDLCGTVDILRYKRDPEVPGSRPDALCTSCYNKRSQEEVELNGDEPNWN